MTDDDAPAIDNEDAAPPSGVGNAASRRAISKTKQRQEHYRRQAVEFWKNVFASPVGRREMWDVLTQLHTFETRFTCGPNGFPNPEATWFAFGEQHSGQRLFDSWTVLDPEGVFLMRREHDPRFARLAPPAPPPDAPDEGGA